MSRPDNDPFGESARPRVRRRLSVLGAEFDVAAADSELMQLAVEAFGNLPVHRLDGYRRRFEVRMARAAGGTRWSRANPPPPPVLSAGAGLLCAILDSGSYVVVDVAMSRALISVSSSLLRFPEIARHELVELAFLTLAGRARALVPLHAACIGADGAGLLLMGPGGAGKSTLALTAFADGMLLLSEDSAFAVPESLLITGTPNYLHVQPGTLAFLPHGELREQIGRSPLIRRRSGISKLKLDLRKARGTIARAPLRLSATVMLSARSAGLAPALRRLEGDAFLRRLRREQPYARNFDNWHAFEHRIAARPSYELRRTSHPKIAIELLRELLCAT